MEFEFPDELMKSGSTIMTPTCNPKETTAGPPYVWSNFGEYPARAIFCTFPETPNPDDPSVTYYVRAHATYRFTKWETKDTLFAFSDVCGDGLGTTTDFAFSHCCVNMHDGIWKAGDFEYGTGEKCDEGQGGCRFDDDCVAGIDCRPVKDLTHLGDICCDDSTADSECVRKFNIFKISSDYKTFCTDA